MRMPEIDPQIRSVCPVCQVGTMERLTRIEHNDATVTTYWRCPNCSHVEVKRTSERKQSRA
jgi:rubredoxin